MKIYNFDEFMGKIRIHYPNASEEKVIDALEWHGFPTEYLDCIDDFLVRKVLNFFILMEIKKET